MILTVESKFHF